MKIGSLFSGIGGFELGLEWAGLGETVWQVENNEFCQKILAKHWPDTKRYGDIKNVGKHNLEPVDLICGGFPCQDISQAGKRAGIKEGTRSGLWFQCKRIVSELRPRFALFENVSAILNYPNLHTVLCDLAEIGYDVEWNCLSADEVGANHERERIFIIAYPKCFSNNQYVGIRQIFIGNKWCKEVWGKSRFKLIMDNNDVAPSKWQDERQSINPRPLLLRNDDGIPHRVDRLKSLGNAVVPQVSMAIGMILKEWIENNPSNINPE